MKRETDNTTIPYRARFRTGLAGFTLMEMLVVIAILAILMGATMTGLQQARRLAWRTRARDTARQLVGAWDLYLIDNREFPESGDLQDTVEGGFMASKHNISEVLNKERVYIELSNEDIEHDGMVDKWKNLFRFNLNFAYDGTLPNPAPESFRGKYTEVKANAIAWSVGHNPSKKNGWRVQW